MIDQFRIGVDETGDLKSLLDEKVGLLTAEGEGSVDEVVIGSWFHLEAMSNRKYWIRVGDTTLWVRLRKNGQVKSVDVEESDTRRIP